MYNINVIFWSDYSLVQPERLTFGDQWQVIDAGITTFLTDYACVLLKASEEIKPLTALSESKSLSMVKADTFRLRHKYGLFSTVNAKWLTQISLTVIELPQGTER
jgi:flagellar assembly factor FliW